MIEQFYSIPYIDGTGEQEKIVRGFSRDELDGLFVHGRRLDVPFGDCNRARPEWCVTHKATGFVVTYAQCWTRLFTFRQACDMQARLDDAFGGWGQIKRNPLWKPGVLDQPSVLGWHGEPMDAARAVFLQWHREGKNPRLKPEWFSLWSGRIKQSLTVA